MPEGSSHCVQCVFVNQADAAEEQADERAKIAKFSHVWNEFIDSLRMEDFISNRLRLLLALDLRHSNSQVS